jgi:hypothetical protein
MADIQNPMNLTAAELRAEYGTALAMIAQQAQRLTEVEADLNEVLLLQESRNPVQQQAEPCVWREVDTHYGLWSPACINSAEPFRSAWKHCPYCGHTLQVQR